MSYLRVFWRQWPVSWLLYRVLIYHIWIGEGRDRLKLCICPGTELWHAKESVLVPKTNLSMKFIFHHSFDFRLKYINCILSCLSGNLFCPCSISYAHSDNQVISDCLNDTPSESFYWINIDDDSSEIECKINKSMKNLQELLIGLLRIDDILCCF